MTEQPGADFLKQVLTLIDQGQPLALCTLVQTRGSTPQKAGAMMAVLTSGQTLGTIGGGCVEAEVRTRALRLLTQPADRLLSFKLDHDLGWDDGLACGGAMDVAVQVIASPAQAKNLRDLHEALRVGSPAQMQITVLDDTGKTAHFVQPIQPAPTLVIAGAGHVASALSAVVSQMDFRLIVIDDRPDFASPTRFPSAAIHLGPVEDELKKVQCDERTFVVIVTRGHRRDAAALSAVIGSDAGYIGLIGSRRKIVKIFAELREQGVSTDQLSRVHAPIGLNVGAVTPVEIAVSIAAELIAVRRQHQLPASASMRLTPAHLARLIESTGESPHS